MWSRGLRYFVEITSIGRVYLPLHDGPDGRVALHDLVEDLCDGAADGDPRRHREQARIVDRADEKAHHRTNNEALDAAVGDVHQQDHNAAWVVLVRETRYESGSTVKGTIENQTPVQRELPDVYDVVEEGQTVALVRDGPVKRRKLRRDVSHGNFEG